MSIPRIWHITGICFLHYLSVRSGQNQSNKILFEIWWPARVIDETMIDDVWGQSKLAIANSESFKTDKTCAKKIDASADSTISGYFF